MKSGRGRDIVLSGSIRPRLLVAGGRTGGSVDVLDLDVLRGIRAGFGGGGERSAFAVCWPNCRSRNTAISSPSVNWLIGRSGPKLGKARNGPLLPFFD